MRAELSTGKPRGCECISTHNGLREKRRKCHKRVEVVTFSDPSNLHDFSFLPLYFLLVSDTQYFRVFICLFQHFEEILKNGVIVTREEVHYPLASLMNEHSDVVIEDTHRSALTLMSP